MSNQSFEVEARAVLPPDVADLYVPIHRDVLEHHAKWEIYRQLYAESEDRIKLLGRSAGITFTFFQDLLFYDALLNFSRLTEGSKSATIARLLDVTAKHVKPKFQQELIADLNDIIDNCKPFKKWRNKRIAHRDINYSVGQTPRPLPPVNRRMIRETNEKIGELLNKIRVEFGLPFTLFTPSMLGDGDALISRLYRAEKADECMRLLISS